MKNSSQPINPALLVWQRVALFAAVCLICPGGLASLAAKEAVAKPPNVVLIISDDQAWKDYGFMGHETIETPHLDRLARESLTFTRGYVPDSLCRPSLMTMITGLYPHQHGITGNDPPKGVDRRKMLAKIARTPTLPEQLKPLGYASLQTGKWWEGHYLRGGFTEGMTHGDPQRGGRHGDLGLKVGRQGLEPIATFLDAHPEEPFFLWYAPFLPHSPHNPPPRLLAKYRDKTDSIHVARYWAMCEWFDETCGELLTMLKDRQLSDNTLVVYVTDNGWIQSKKSPRYAPRSKRSPNEGGIRTPIMLHWPGKIEPRRDDETLVHSIDLAPTILAACGVKPTSDLPGENLLPLADGGKLKRDAIFGAIYEHDVPDLDAPCAGLMYRWTISGQHKLILPADDASPQLFDLAADPDERKNLAEQSPGRVSELRKRLDAWFKCGK